MVLTKFTGSRGKSGTSDASAEYIGWLRGCMGPAPAWFGRQASSARLTPAAVEQWQRFIANQNIDVVDLGVPVISMHAPYEAIAKVDLYEAYRAFTAFNRD